MSTKIRNLNAQSLTDEDVVGLSWAGRLVWAYLPCYADREGRMDDKPRSLRLQMLPHNPEVDMEEILAEFARLGFIVRYKIGEHDYIQIKSWSRYQKPYPREPASKRPDPNGIYEAGTENQDDLPELPDQPDHEVKTISLVRTDDSFSHTERDGVPSPQAPPYERESCWEMVKIKWAEAGRWPGGENMVAAKKKFQAKIDFRNWPRFWQGICWAVGAAKLRDERKYLGVLCTFLDEAKWKDQEPPEPDPAEAKSATDQATALAAMGY